MSTQIADRLDQAQSALSTAADDFDRLQVRDTARAVQAAAEVLQRRDIQVAAAALVCDAERAIARANPPLDPQTAGGLKGVAAGAKPFSASTLSKMRRAHSPLDGLEYQALKQKSIEQGEPLTRQLLIDAATKKREQQRRDHIAALAAQADVDAPDAPDCRLLVCPVDQLADHVAAGSVDVVITDPPYVRELLDTWDALGRFAAHALKPGGLLVALSGNVDALECLNRLNAADGLQYWFMGAYVLSKHHGRIIPRRFFVGSKPLLFFSRGEYAGPMRHNTVQAPSIRSQDKRFHHWGQNEVAFCEIVRRWAVPGWTVCDPFLGGGTTAVAARAHRCHFIGADVDADCIQTTRGRLALDQTAMTNRYELEALELEARAEAARQDPPDPDGDFAHYHGYGLPQRDYAALSPDEKVAYLRTLPPQERADLARQWIDEEDEETEEDEDWGGNE